FASVAAAEKPVRAGTVQLVEHVVQIESGERFDAILLEEGFAAAEVEAYKVAQRRDAVRRAYELDDAAAIAEIEAQLTALEIETARTTPGTSRAPLKAGDWAYSNCSSGQGATSGFRIFGSWTAHWQTSGGSNTSSQTGHCGDWFSGCWITDSISGNPSLAWKRHYAGANDVGAHTADCT
ncbi:MAG: hypothetical protein AAGE94_18895, partial [Acidobacteriota bacterium]